MTVPTPEGAPKKAAAKKKTVAKPVVAVSALAHETAVRAQCVTIAHYLIDQQPSVHYPPNDARTMQIHGITTLNQLHALVEAGRLMMDCSQAVTLVAHVAGAKDPNGGNYASDGWTGTLVKGTKITKQQAKAGDLRVYGSGDGHHVCMVIAKGADPLLFSHGSERGPLSIRDSVEAKYQPAGGCWLRLPI